MAGAHSKPGPRLSLSLLGAGVWVAIAFVLYRPLRARPLDIMDFPGFVAVLDRPGSFWSHFTSLLAYHAASGRWKPLDTLLTVTRWSIFGRSTVGWQIAGFAEMAAFSLLLYLVLRRWGANRIGSFAATMLGVASLAAAQGWMRLSVSDEVGGAFMLGAMLAVSGIRDASRWRGRLVAAAVAIACMVWTKEILVALVPAIWFVAASSNADGSLGRPRLTRRVAWFGAMTGFLCVLLLVPVAMVAARSTADSYAHRFGSGSISVVTVVGRYLVTMVPFVPADVPTQFAVVVADVAFVGLLSLGCSLVLARPPRRQAAVLIGFALALPLLGVLAYLPWPKFDLFYAIPLLPGLGVLVAFAFTGISLRAPRAMPLALLAWAWVTVYMASDSFRYARNVDASVRTVVDATHVLERLPPDDTAALAVCDLTIGAWWDPATTVAWYARSEHRSVPVIRNVACPDSLSSTQLRLNTVVIAGPGRPKGTPDQVLTNVAPRIDWRHLRVARDTMQTRIFSAKRTPGS